MGTYDWMITMGAGKRKNRWVLFCFVFLICVDPTKAHREENFPNIGRTFRRRERGRGRGKKEGREGEEKKKRKPGMLLLK